MDKKECLYALGDMVDLIIDASQKLLLDSEEVDRFIEAQKKIEKFLSE